jgi:drug/metabolite transporter (DMT)-like permease
VHGSVGRGTALALLAVVVVLWGVNWPIMKIGVSVIPPVWFAVLRTVLGAGSLFAFLLASGRFAWPTRRDLPVIASVGLLQVGVFLVLVNVALQHVDAGRSAVLAYTTPLWVGPGAILLLKERPKPLKIAGLLLGLAGVALLFSPAAIDWNDRAELLGNLLLMLAAAGWAIAILHVRGSTWTLSLLQLLPWQLLISTPILVLIAWRFEGPPAFELSPTVLAILAYNGPVASGFCYWAVLAVTRSLPATTTSLSLLAIPAAGLIASTLALGESIGATLAGGCALILGGVALVNLGDRKSARP